MPTAEFLQIRYQTKVLHIAIQRRLASSNVIAFLHGFGCAKECFSEAFQQEELRDFSLCTFDFPGYGDSSTADKAAYSMEAYAEVTNQVIDSFSPKRVYLACHSMGGAVGLIASQARKDVECYVSIDGNLVAEDCGLVSRQAANQTSTEYTKTGYNAFLAQLRRSSRRDYAAWATWSSKADPIALHENATSLVEWSDSGKLLELFSALPCRAYFYGDADDKQYLTSALANVPVYTVPNSGHFMMIDNPQNFYATLATFFRAPQVCTMATVDGSSLGDSRRLIYSASEKALEAVLQESRADKIKMTPS